jgi:hypothetical protein
LSAVRALGLQGGYQSRTLLDVAWEMAGERGHQVLHARGSELMRGVPFGVAVELFAEALRAATPAAARDPSLPMVHGLYWLLVNLSECAAVPGGGRRPLGRRAVAALLALPRRTRRRAPCDRPVSERCAGTGHTGGPAIGRSCPRFAPRVRGRPREGAEAPSRPCRSDNETATPPTSGRRERRLRAAFCLIPRVPWQ